MFFSKIKCLVVKSNETIRTFKPRYPNREQCHKRSLDCLDEEWRSMSPREHNEVLGEKKCFDSFPSNPEIIMKFICSWVSVYFWNLLHKERAGSKETAWLTNCTKSFVSLWQQGMKWWGYDAVLSCFHTGSLSLSLYVHFHSCFLHMLRLCLPLIISDMTHHRDPASHDRAQCIHSRVDGPQGVECPTYPKAKLTDLLVCFITMCRASTLRFPEITRQSGQCVGYCDDLSPEFSVERFCLWVCSARFNTNRTNYKKKKVQMLLLEITSCVSEGFLR